jgi:ActR/RegA family two-component response regulator
MAEIAQDLCHQSADGAHSNPIPHRPVPLSSSSRALSTSNPEHRYNDLMRSAGYDTMKPVKFDELKKYFHLNMNEAARALGISRTTLQKVSYSIL